MGDALGAVDDMQLITERLLVRSFQPEDVGAYAEIVADPEVMRYLGQPLGYEAARDYVLDCIERDQSNGISRYAVLLQSGERFIGFCGFKALCEDASGQVPVGQRWIDFGWRYSRSVWRSGYGFEAAQAVYQFGKQTLGLSGIESRAHRDNLGSLRIIEKLGFRWCNDYESGFGVFRRYREPE